MDKKPGEFSISKAMNKLLFELHEAELQLNSLQYYKASSERAINILRISWTAVAPTISPEVRATFESALSALDIAPQTADSYGVQLNEFWRHNKTGMTYQANTSYVATDCTNDNAAQEMQMVIYRNKAGQLFVRERREFLEKFYRVKET